MLFHCHDASWQWSVIVVVVVPKDEEREYEAGIRLLFYYLALPSYSTLL